MSATELVRPELEHVVKLDDGETKTIRMSYGLLIDLQMIAPDPSAVIEIIASDPVSRDFLVRRAFTDSKKSLAKVEEFVTEIPVDDPDEVEKLVSWLADHLLYFFTKSARALAEKGERYKSVTPTTDQPAPSEAGSKDSVSSTPTAGPSTVASETS